MGKSYATAPPRSSKVLLTRPLVGYDEPEILSYQINLNGFVPAEVDVGRCDVVQALV